MKCAALRKEEKKESAEKKENEEATAASSNCGGCCAFFCLLTWRSAPRPTIKNVTLASQSEQPSFFLPIILFCNDLYRAHGARSSRKSSKKSCFQPPLAVSTAVIRDLVSPELISALILIAVFGPLRQARGQEETERRGQQRNSDDSNKKK